MIAGSAPLLNLLCAKSKPAMSEWFAPREEQLKRASKGLGVPVSRLQEDVQIVKGWVESQPHLPDPVGEDGLLYENMLMRCKGSVELTKQAIDFYCSQRAAVPEFFADRDPCGESLTKALTFWNYAVLKDLTPEGYRVLVFKIEPQDYLDDFSFDQMIKWWIMDADVRLKEDVNLGEVFIHDQQYLRLGHVIKATATVLYKAVVCVLNGFKSHVKGIHILNAPPVAEILFTAVRSVLPKKIKARFFVHQSIESLHKHVCRSVLPKTYGGDRHTFEELAGAWTDEMKGRRDWILAKDLRCRTDETKRPGQGFNADEHFGTEGTFRQLAVD